LQNKKMNMKILQELRKELKEKSSPEAKRAFRKFFKRNENIKSYGVKSGEVEKIAGKYYRKIKNLSKQEIFNLCEKLFSSKYMEEAFIASIWCQKLKNSFTKDDFNLFEKWIDKYIDNWAVCDGFCSRDISILIEKYPICTENLKKWAKSENKWLRRASAVSLVNPAKKGKFQKEVFEVCEILLMDKEDMVQKGYGWLLKSASKSNENKVFEYILARKDKMPRTSLRYAVENMSPKNKATLMRK